ARQGYWQVLPQGPTSYGDSPYQSFSTFAGNPYFIDLVKLIDQGLLMKWECDECYFGDNQNYIDYKALYDTRLGLLKRAFDRADISQDENYASFKKENEFWLEDYALYMAIKTDNGGVSWQEWQRPLKTRQPQALENAGQRLSREVEFYRYIQFLFFEQWNRLKRYANDSGIEIIGDLPIYVALDSADVWANPELFHLDEDFAPIEVAGCPPDAFSMTGQLWGNPLYDWQQHTKTGFSWWLKRIKSTLTMYDVVRIDHFRGFDEYYAIPYGSETAERGVWKKAPGEELFQAIKQQLGQARIIAEDLGVITPTVKSLLAKTGYPGMKVMQFAFYKGCNSDYLLHNHIKNSVVYTGTHDNRTSKGWFCDMSWIDKNYAGQYMGFATEEWDKNRFLRHVMSSPANLVIVPIQDYMELGDEARINTPSTMGNNWKWRMSKGQFTPDICRYMAYITRLYFRE
ncbi:MAG: 4-alpha-glucanotransferase, partial [Oscillospiraceae bacterium]